MNKRWLAAFILLQVMLAALGWGFSIWITKARIREIIAASPTSSPIIKLFGSAARPSPAFYDNMRQSGRFYITDPAYGAICDGSHDDTAAVNAALLAAQGSYTGATGGPIAGKVIIPNVLVACKVTSTIQVNYPAYIQGEGNTAEQAVIIAGAIMGSVFQIRSTFGQVGAFAANESTDRVILKDFTIDANQQSDHGLLLVGAEWSIIENVRLRRARFAGLRTVNTMLPLILSSVTPSSGGIGGVTVSQPDPFYQDAQQDGTVNFVAKVIDPGALDTATLAISADNGATYATGKQPLSAVTNLVIADTGGVQGLYGIQASFPVHNYATNEKYSFTATTQAADFGLSEAAVAEITYRDIVTAFSGPLIATPGLVGAYNGYNLTTGTGTCGTTSGSQYITCPGAHLLSFLGSGHGRGAIQINSQIFQVPAILSDTVMAVTSGTEPQFTLSGLDYAYFGGGGVYEDGHLDGPDEHWDSGNSNFDSICYQFDGLIGVYFAAPTLSACGIGLSIGGGNVTSMGFNTFINFHIASQAGGNAAFLLSPNSKGEILEPSGVFTTAGGPSGWILRRNGSDSPLSPFGAQSWLQQFVLQITPSFQTLTAANQQIALPSFTSQSGGRSGYLRLTVNGDYTLSASPTIPPPPADTAGIIYVIQNDTFNLVTFLADSETGNGLLMESDATTLGYKQIIAFASTGLHGTPWRELWHSTSAYGGGTRLGNLGRAPFRTQTVSSTTPVQLARFNVVNSGVAPGSAVTFDVAAQSQNGANSAWWLGCQAAWSPTGVRIFSNIGASPGNCTSAFGYTGGVAGGVPLGWALTIDPSGTTPYARVFFAGDSSANPVTVTIDLKHMDPGQQDVLPTLTFAEAFEPCLPRRWRRRADNDNDFECDETMAA
jgi:hypothetical protein